MIQGFGNHGIGDNHPTAAGLFPVDLADRTVRRAQVHLEHGPHNRFGLEAERVNAGVRALTFTAEDEVSDVLLIGPQAGDGRNGQRAGSKADIAGFDFVIPEIGIHDIHAAGGGNQSSVTGVVEVAAVFVQNLPVIGIGD